LEPTAEPTTEPTPSLQRPQSATDAGDFVTDFHHITASTLNLETGGSGYSIGDTLSIGEGLPGWVTPATMTVTGVDGNGGITSEEVVDGGEIDNDANEALRHPDGTLSTFSLIQAIGQQQPQGTSAALAASKQRSTPHSVRGTVDATAVKVGMTCGGLVGLFAVVAVLVRNSRRSGTAAADVPVLTELTPTAISAV
jgi:hypothetical protein